MLKASNRRTAAAEIHLTRQQAASDAHQDSGLVVGSAGLGTLVGDEHGEVLVAHLVSDLAERADA